MATRLDSYFLPGKSVAVSDYFAFVSGRHCSGLALRPWRTLVFSQNSERKWVFSRSHRGGPDLKGFDAETISGLTAILGGLSPRNPVSPIHNG
jgi:hypothetical protein